MVGDLPRERRRPRRVLVDVAMEVDGAVAASDSLEDTVDYAALAERIRAVLVAAKCRMIERAAYLAAATCLEDPHVASASVRVTKSGAVRGLGSASAVCRLAKRREKGYNALA